MIVKLLAEHHLEFLSLKGGCTGLSESTLVKMPHFWKSHVAAHFVLYLLVLYLKLPDKALHVNLFTFLLRIGFSNLIILP